jgi:16S rRNA (cytosine1402-N4)-methyltransferase
MVEPSSVYHIPVLLEAVVAAAADAGRVVDATLGGGGHTEALRLAGREILAIDRDPDAIVFTRSRLGDQGIRYLEAAYDSPAAMRAITSFHPGFILLDLGVSSRQLDATERGFTFRPGAPLDMRMGGGGPSAADVLNEAETALTAGRSVNQEAVDKNLGIIKQYKPRVASMLKAYCK